MRTCLDLKDIDQLIQCKHQDPSSVLGPHIVEQAGTTAVSVRAFLPDAPQAWIVDPAHPNTPKPMKRIHPKGFYEILFPLNAQGEIPYYQLEVADNEGNRKKMDDPYAFPSQLTEFDIHLLNEGRHWDVADKLGAHPLEIDGVKGTLFIVWAPNATYVSVVGDFNHWDGRCHPMKKHFNVGLWELFIPGIEEGEVYKYRITHDGHSVDKADPFGFAAELPPRTASKVWDISKFDWNDKEWMDKRAGTNYYQQPVSIYELHLGSWKRDPGEPGRWLSYRELAPMITEYVLEMGYTHVELMPISEHPFTASWGYQTVGYFAPTSRYGTPDDFKYFVDFLHQNGIGVILDWVPAHFPKDGHGLRMFDGTHLYEHADPRQGEHADWGTLIFNYSRWEIRNFLIANALFWLKEYHIDGLRVDAVASMIYLDYSREEGQWIPNEFGGRENLGAIDFIKDLNVLVHQKHPGALMIAEESTSWGGVSRPTYVGGLGFSMKWNMGWMNDVLEYMSKEAIHRKYHHNDLTFSMIYAFTENFVLALSHDEVVHGKGSILDKMPGDLWQKFANLRLLYAYMWMHPGKKLLFMGDDFGQWEEWNFDSSLQWHLLEWSSHSGLKRMVSDLNSLLRSEPALYELDFEQDGFEWVDCHNWEESVLTFMRKAKDPKDYLIVVCNFTPVPRTFHRIGVPELIKYKEVFNSDSEFYDGSNAGNPPVIEAEKIDFHGRPYSMDVVLPPLGVSVLKPIRD